MVSRVGLIQKGCRVLSAIVGNGQLKCSETAYWLRVVDRLGEHDCGYSLFKWKVR